MFYTSTPYEPWGIDIRNMDLIYAFRKPSLATADAKEEKEIRQSC